MSPSQCTSSPVNVPPGFSSIFKQIESLEAARQRHARTNPASKPVQAGNEAVGVYVPQLLDMRTYPNKLLDARKQEKTRQDAPNACMA